MKMLEWNYFIAIIEMSVKGRLAIMHTPMEFPFPLAEGYEQHQFLCLGIRTQPFQPWILKPFVLEVRATLSAEISTFLKGDVPL